MFSIARSVFASLVIVAGVFGIGSAHAAPITGDVSFAGGFTPNGTIGAGGTATAIDFDPMGAGGNLVVTLSSGDFAAEGVVGGTMGTITDFTFSPFVGPIASFWTLGMFSFQLNSITSVDFSTMGMTNFLLITGEGVISHPDFDDTTGTWSFSGQQGDTTFSFSGSSVAWERLPEPATLLLMGVGLAGLGVATRRKRQPAVA